MSLRTNNTPLLPKLNRKRALFVLSRSTPFSLGSSEWRESETLALWSLAVISAKVRAGQYWRVESIKSFDEFLERRFPASRRKAYYLMSIHEYLPPQIRRELKQVGWTKAAELTKVARSDGQDFDCATWLHKARELPKEHFKHEVEKHLTGKDMEPTEIIYFKLYKSQLPVIEQAVETAALMLVPTNPGVIAWK